MIYKAVEINLKVKTFNFKDKFEKEVIKTFWSLENYENENTDIIEKALISEFLTQELNLTYEEAEEIFIQWLEREEHMISYVMNLSWLF